MWEIWGWVRLAIQTWMTPWLVCTLFSFAMELPAKPAHGGVPPGMQTQANQEKGKEVEMSAAPL